MVKSQIVYIERYGRHFQASFEEFMCRELFHIWKSDDFQYLEVSICVWIGEIHWGIVWECVWTMMMRSNPGLLEPWWATAKPSKIKLSKSQPEGCSQGPWQLDVWYIATYHCWKSIFQSHVRQERWWFGTDHQSERHENVQVARKRIVPGHHQELTTFQSRN